MSDPSTYDLHAPQLLARGFFPLSIGPGTKKPQHFVPSLNQYHDTTGWTHPARPPETSPQPGAGIGVRLGEQAGGTYVVALDWDDAEAAIIAIKVWPPTVTKEGQRGFTAFYRSSNPIPSRDFRVNGHVAVQVLSDGRQTVVPPTMHPDVNRPYVWTSKFTLYNAGVGDLPILPDDYIAQIETILRPLGYEAEAPKPETNGHDTDEDDNPFQQLNGLALKNLAAWVPDLGLYGCRRRRGPHASYEAIATWRPSTTGRPTEERERNLQINGNRGIKDFGTGEGYSPINLVMRARNCARRDAVAWLAERLQPKTSPEVDFEALAKNEKAPDVPHNLNDRAAQSERSTTAAGTPGSRKGDENGKAKNWPEPKLLPSGLPAVHKFSLDFMPEPLVPWIDDVATRLQCPPDYVAITAIVALGSVIGRRVGIKPQVKTDWVEVPNLWGGFIGRPGQLKSPAMQAALGPLHRLEAEAQEEHKVAREAYEHGISAYKVRKQVKIALEKKELKKARGGKIDLNFDLPDEPGEPVAVRYQTNDTSYEALGELLRDNPSGILIERDELISLLKHLDREEQVVARGFFLSGWDGKQPYSFDRIGRGHVALEAVCLSIIGGTQPARIGEYVRRANRGGVGGDGLIQRFALLVWPDAPTGWKDVDEYPKVEARERAWQTFERAARLDLWTALKRGAVKGAFDKIPCFRFDDAAHDDFLGWRTDLEKRLRSGDISPALEGHLAKYRKLVPALALINHIAEDNEGDVTQKSLVRALSFVVYLESHARRIYSSGSESEVSAASAILKHIRAGDLTDGFTARDVLRHGWSHLPDRDQISAGLNLLDELDHLAAVESASVPHGGRPKTIYRFNPRSIR
jgi:putative DNA primase/helicase